MAKENLLNSYLKFMLFPKIKVIIQTAILPEISANLLEDIYSEDFKKWPKYRDVTLDMK